MKKIDVTEWKKYTVKELFDIHPTKSYKINNAFLFDGGNNPVIVNSSYNNGIGGFSSKENTECGNIITFSDTTSEDSIFYQPTDFIGYPHVQGMYPLPPYEKEWDKKSLLFFLVLFKKSVKSLNVNYVNKFTREMANNIVLTLPTNTDGSLDFAYMRRIEEKEIRRQERALRIMQKLCNSEALPKKQVAISHWRDFPISQLFDIVKGTRLTKKDMRLGVIRFIGASAVNNGITAYIANDECLHPANTITVNYNGSVGVSFYQDEPFWASDDVNVLYPKFQLNKDIAMFLIPIITKTGKERYEFIDKWKKEYMEKDTIKLPATVDGRPDFTYMQNFISSMSAKAAKHLAQLATLN